VDCNGNGNVRCPNSPRLGKFYCEACYDPELARAAGDDSWNIGRSEIISLADAVGIMRGGDWLTLMLVSAVVGLYIAAEVEDCRLCGLIVYQNTQQQRDAGRLELERPQRSEVESDFEAPQTRAEPPQTPNASGDGDGGSKCSFHVSALYVLVSARQFGLLPMVTGTVTYLVLYRGSTAMQLTFNGVALLFLLEFDDLIFSHFLSAAVRRALVPPRLGPPETQLLATTKPLHAAAAACCIFFGAMYCGARGLDEAAMLMAFLGFWAVRNGTQHLSTNARSSTPEYVAP
jgi:hypothetical protein